MREEVLLALMLLLEDDLEAVESLRGKRGIRGPSGTPFIFEDHKEEIRNTVVDHFTQDEDFKSNLRGKDGVDGVGFSWEKYQEQVRGIIYSLRDTLSLSFSDLSSEEKLEVQGERGPRGQRGKGFVFEEHEDSIKSILTTMSDSFKLRFEDLTDENKDALKLTFDNLTQDEKGSLKLRFDDLTEEDKESLRGKRGIRGQKGSPGKDFIFEEHQEYFDSLKPKFADFTEEEKAELSLSEEDKEKLKLKFTDLDENDLAQLKGDRGPRGQKGREGLQGESVVGPQGAIGPMGPMGVPGLSGRDGRNGKDAIAVNGKDAPVVEEISIKERKDSIAFDFDFDNGTTLQTNYVKLPSKTTKEIYTSVGFSSSSGESGSTDSASKLAFDKVLGEDIAAFKIVSLSDSATIVKGNMNTVPVCHGIITASGITGETRTVIMFGIVEDPSFTFALNKKLFLGLDGEIIDTMPSGDNYVVIGKSLGAGAIFITIEEPEAL